MKKYKRKLVVVVMAIFMLMVTQSVYAAGGTVETNMDPVDGLTPEISVITDDNQEVIIYNGDTGLTGETLGGTIQYDPTSNTLTLNNATDIFRMFIVLFEDLTVNVKGNNVMSGSMPLISAAFNTLIFTGDGSLAIDNSDPTMVGILGENVVIDGATIEGKNTQLRATDTFTIEDGNVEIVNDYEPNNSDGAAIYATSGDIIIKGGDIKANSNKPESVPALMTDTYSGGEVKLKFGADVQAGNDLNNLNEYVISYDGQGCINFHYDVQENEDDSDNPTEDTESNAVAYQTHVQNVGWQELKKDGDMSGTEGRSLRLEGIKIDINQDLLGDVDVEYKTHIQNIGWESQWSEDGEMSGTEGRSLRLEGIQIELTGADADQYDIYYQVHAQNMGWLGWAVNGEQAGTAGYGYRLEGIRIIIQPKGTEAPVSDQQAFYENI